MPEKLRNNNRDALRRRKRMIKSGAAATYIKPWKFEAQMEFLLQFMVNENRGTNFTTYENNTEFEELGDQVQEEEVVENPDEQVVDEYDGRSQPNEDNVETEISNNQSIIAPLLKSPSAKNLS